MYGDTIGVLCFYKEVSLKRIRYVYHIKEKTSNCPFCERKNGRPSDSFSQKMDSLRPFFLQKSL